MGYTLSWNTKKGKSITKEETEKCVEAIKQIIEKHKDIVEIEFIGKSELNKWNINFNGIGDDAHETFCFYSYYDKSSAEMIMGVFEDREFNEDYISPSGKLGRTFCKTARKPYDEVIKECFIKIQEITNNKFDINCDDGFVYTKKGVKKNA
jgi:hypothetical protein